MELGAFLRIMANPLKYISGKNGNKVSVLVPIKTWQKLNKNYSKLQFKLRILAGISTGMQKQKRQEKQVKNYNP